MEDDKIKNSFADVAFPIMRRVFGGLIANELVQVQPMMAPAGVIFGLGITKEQLLNNLRATKDHFVPVVDLTKGQ